MAVSAIVSVFWLPVGSLYGVGVPSVAPGTAAIVAGFNHLFDKVMAVIVTSACSGSLLAACGVSAPQKSVCRVSLGWWRALAHQKLGRAVVSYSLVCLLICNGYDLHV